MGRQVTWRFVVMVSFAILGVLLLRVLTQIDKTADLATSLQASVVALVPRVDFSEREIIRLRDAIYRSRSSPLDAARP